MKAQELRQLIREEIRKVLKEEITPIAGTVSKPVERVERMVKALMKVVQYIKNEDIFLAKSDQGNKFTPSTFYANEQGKFSSLISQPIKTGKYKGEMDYNPALKNIAGVDGLIRPYKKGITEIEPLPLTADTLSPVFKAIGNNGKYYGGVYYTPSTLQGTNIDSSWRYEPAGFLLTVNSESERKQVIELADTGKYRAVFEITKNILLLQVVAKSLYV